MAQLVTVTETCDRHAAEGDPTKAATPRIVGFDGVWYAVGACDPHDRKLIEPARDYATQQGRVIDKLPAAARRALLKAAGLDEGASISELPTAQTAPVVQPAQLAKSNNTKTTAAKGKGGVKSDKPRRHTCLFGCDEAQTTFTTTTGLMLHLQTKHGLPRNMAEVFGLDCPLCGSHAESGKLGVHLAGRRHKGLTVTEAFIKARNSGDRHGIVEKILGQR